MTISITPGTIVKAVFILALAWLLFTLRDLALIVLTAIVIASALEPGIAALTRYRIPRILSVIVMYATLLGTFFLVFYLFVPSILDEFTSFVVSLPVYLEAFTRMGVFETYSGILGLPPATAFSSVHILAQVREVFDFWGFFGTAGQIFGGLFAFILIMVFSFYFALVKTGVEDFIRIASPAAHRPYLLDLWRRSQHKIGLWMQGQLLLAFIVGVLVYLGLTVLGVPYALMLAVIAALFEIIPVFGPILAAIPAVIIAFAAGGTPLGLFVIALYIIVQQFENHLIYPLVVTHVVGVPPLLVILALIIGAELAGFLGIVLSVPIAATLQEFIRDMQEGKLPSAREVA